MRKSISVFVLSVLLSFSLYSQLSNGTCLGKVLISESFENGMPADWIVLDLDSAAPHENTGLSSGWNVIQDYRDSTNMVVANCSWNNPSTPSEDWLILPMVLLDSSNCLSWTAYSQDPLHPETYGVWVSHGGMDSSDFFSNDTLFYEDGEGSNPSTHSISITGFPGEMVYVGFRHFSADAYVFVLDDISLSSQYKFDVQVSQLETVEAEALGYNLIKGQIYNGGFDTITSLQLKYSVDGDFPLPMTFNGIQLPPSTGMEFEHPAGWIPQGLGDYSICAWTVNPNGLLVDDYPLNDTACMDLSVTSFVSLADDFDSGLTFFPNPSSSHVEYIHPEKKDLEAIRITDINGKEIISLKEVHYNKAINIENLESGIYFIQGKVGKKNFHSKIMKME